MRQREIHHRDSSQLSNNNDNKTQSRGFAPSSSYAVVRVSSENLVTRVRMETEKTKQMIHKTRRLKTEENGKKEKNGCCVRKIRR